ncbi:MAG: tyrosine-type recombinase/integrase [Proteobacteria bacterium]|nr:tyrosine-type recombinase/integrase [Pseudomonadota bacterium]
MLNEMKLRALKPTEKMYKVADRDGMYVAVLPSGVVSFRFDYRFNGRRETLTLGTYGRSGISLAEARGRLVDARRLIASGVSPAAEKRRKKDQLASAKSFGHWAREWVAKYKMAESTRAMRLSVIERDLLPAFDKRKLAEVTEVDLRALCDKIVARGAPATAVHAREIVMGVFDWANLKGEKAINPAHAVRPCSIATFEARERALSPEEVGVAFRLLEQVSTQPTNRLALRLVLLTMIRKGMLVGAKWEEIRWKDAVWEVPAARMKGRKTHLVYLSQQALDILVALQTCAGSSPYIVPGRYDGDRSISMATLNQVTKLICTRAVERSLPLAHFTVHDLRRTASTLLHEAGFNSDWIEKCLAHEQRGVRAVYNKAEYAAQRRDMLQQWADMVDSWIAGSGAAVVPIMRAA